MANRTIPSGFLKNVVQNGVGRYVCQLQRITLKFCKSHGSSRGTRDFIEDYLLDFTRNHPGVVVYLKPMRHRPPILQAEYLNGHLETAPLSQLNKDDIYKWVNLMKGRSGQQEIRKRKTWHTDTPSIQGVWHPFMFKDPAVSVADMMDRKLHECFPSELSATDKLLELYKKNMTLSDGDKDKIGESSAS